MASFKLAQILLASVAIVSAGAALAAGPYALVTGRRDPRIIVIDIGKAIDPANNGTQSATVKPWAE